MPMVCAPSSFFLFLHLTWIRRFSGGIRRFSFVFFQASLACMCTHVAYCPHLFMRAAHLTGPILQRSCCWLCWFDVEPASTGALELQTTIIVVNSTANVETVFPANTRHWANVGLMLVHRLRRLPNIKQLLTQCLVFAENDVVWVTSQVQLKSR